MSFSNYATPPSSPQPGDDPGAPAAQGPRGGRSTRSSASSSARTRCSSACSSRCSTGGHVLLEGVPGLAKTLTVRTLADVMGGTFRRIQFTPDLVPADLVGTRIYRPDTGRFDTELGPVFGNFLLADEINRAPAKVQSALLEVMQEHQVTIGTESFPVPHPFLVLATQNPIESEGTYPLPEAQIDRFLFKVLVDYPTLGEEASIVGRSLRPPEHVGRCACRCPSSSASSTRWRRSSSTARSSPTPCSSSTARATPSATASTTSRTSSSTAPARAGRSAWSRRRARWRCCAAGATCSSTTCATSPPTSCATASCCPTTRCRTASAPTTSSTACSPPLGDGRAVRRAGGPDRVRRRLARCPRRTPPCASRPPARDRGRSRPPLVDALALSLARRGAGVLPGDRLAPGVGSGTELAQLRPYQLGDDVRQLDAGRQRAHRASRTCACRCPSASSRPGSCSTSRRRWPSAPPTA